MDLLPVIGGGRTRFQPLHIADAVRTLMALLERPETAGTTLALVGPETFAFRELLERLLAMLGWRRLLVPLPFALAEALAAGLERLPHPSLTQEEVRLLRTDKVVGGVPTPSALGLAARRLEEGLPASLHVAEPGQGGRPGEGALKPSSSGLVGSTVRSSTRSLLLRAHVAGARFRPQDLRYSQGDARFAAALPIEALRLTPPSTMSILAINDKHPNPSYDRAGSWPGGDG